MGGNCRRGREQVAITSLLTWQAESPGILVCKCYSANNFINEPEVTASNTIKANKSLMERNSIVSLTFIASEFGL